MEQQGNMAEALERIKEVKKTKGSQLDLSALGLNMLPPEVFGLSDTLKTLNLAHNNIVLSKDLLRYTGAMPQLEYLNVENTNLAALGLEYYAALFPGLKNLSMANNSTGNEGLLIACEAFLELTYIDISNNLIDTSVFKRIILKNISGFTYISLSGNVIDHKALSLIALRAKKLVLLNIDNCSIPGSVITAIKTFPGSLAYLNISNNEISENAVIHIARSLKNLTLLNIAKTNVGDEGITFVAKNLKKLTHLSLWSNNITDKGITAIAEHLPDLEILDIDDNNVQQEGLYALYKAYGKKENFSLFFAHNKIALPPAAMENWQTLKEYFHSIETEEATVAVNALNVLLLGNTTAGKSSLLEYYLDGTFKEGKQSTFGISHINKELVVNGTKTEVSFWDFGGQEYFHGTHRLFMSTRNALYLLLWERIYEGADRHKNANNEDCFPFRYWLGTIRHFSTANYHTDNEMYQRAMLVQSKTDMEGAQPIYIADAFTDPDGRFGLPVGNIYPVSVKTAFEQNEESVLRWQLFRLRFNEMIQQYKACYQFNKHIIGIRNEALPQWRKEHKMYVDREEFKNRCIAYYADADKYAELIPQYLEDSGEIIRFPVPQLRDKIFIDPKMLLEKIYSVLDNSIRDKAGRFTKKDIVSKEKDVLLEILLHMELVFINPQNTEEYIAPQYMKEDHASALLQHLRTLLKPSFSLRFPDYMPRAYITQFISRKGCVSEEGVFWKFGVLYRFRENENSGGRVLVEADPESRFVRVYAEDTAAKYKAVKEVFDFFAFYERDKAREKEKAKEADNTKAETDPAKKTDKLPDFMPVRYLELSADGKNYAAIGEILNAIDSKTAKVKNTEGDYMPVDSIFHVLLNKNAVMPKKVFFSYAHADKQYRDEFEKHLAALKREGLVSTWNDAMIKPGSDWDATIKEELEKADVVLYMLSPSFMQSEYIWQSEVKKFAEQKRNGLFMFICISPCDFETTVLGPIQGVPHNDQQQLQWVALEEQLARRDQHYLQIVKTIRELIRQAV